MYISFLEELHDATNELLEVILPNKGKPIRVGQIPGFLEAWIKYIETRKKLKSWIDNIKGPIFAAIDITYRCNLKCPYCYLAAPQRTAAPSLCKDNVFKIIDELSELEVLGICLCRGEPTLHRDFFEIIEYANSKGIGVNFVSNGTLITDKFASKLSELNIGSVQISLDGSKSEIMDLLRGKGTFNKAVDAIKNLVDYNINTAVAFCATSLNIHDFPNTVELALDLGVFEVRSMYFVPESERHLNLIPTEEQYSKLITWINENSGHYPLKITFGDPTEHIVIGPYLNSVVLTISAEGYILPTPYLNLAYGHIEEGINNLWPELQNIWRDNPVLLALSAYIKTEKDFLKLNKLLLTRKECGEYINLRELPKDAQFKLSQEIRGELT